MRDKILSTESQLNAYYHVERKIKKDPVEWNIAWCELDTRNLHYKTQSTNSRRNSSTSSRIIGNLDQGTTGDFDSRRLLPFAYIWTTDQFPKTLDAGIAMESLLAERPLAGDLHEVTSIRL